MPFALTTLVDPGEHLLHMADRFANYNLPHLYLSPPLGLPHWNFAEIYGIRKLGLESLGFRTAYC